MNAESAAATLLTRAQSVPTQHYGPELKTPQLNSLITFGANPGHEGGAGGGRDQEHDEQPNPLG